MGRQHSGRGKCGSEDWGGATVRVGLVRDQCEGVGIAQETTSTHGWWEYPPANRIIRCVCYRRLVIVDAFHSHTP